jgi:hypothetical protein
MKTLTSSEVEFRDGMYFTSILINNQRTEFIHIIDPFTMKMYYIGKMLIYMYTSAFRPNKSLDISTLSPQLIDTINDFACKRGWRIKDGQWATH